MNKEKRRGWRVFSTVDRTFNRIYGSRFNPLYQSGAIAILLLFILLATGLYLLLFYRLGQPWASVQRITLQGWGGRWIRGVHRFASDAAVVAVAVHAFRMYAQRRDWGPRALAWLSGLVLLGVVFVCGWTGYVMVWDTHAQLIAVEGARLLDLLPIFSEPISRTFVGERAMPSAFFFLNLFAHVALPIGLALLVWIHVSRVARPVFMPPRALQLSIVAALVLLAVVWPLSMGARADLLHIPEKVPLDMFYAFWLPLTRDNSPHVVWALGSGIVLALLLLPFWSRPRKADRPAKSVVNERHCTGCEQCMHDCPYGAIEMIPRSDGREGIIARVNPDLCVACGVCVASCAPMALGPADQTARDQLALARAWHAQRGQGLNDVVVIGCDWSAANARADAFNVGCAGALHTSTIEYFVRAGVGGVLIATCPERDCRAREGPKWLHERVYNEREAELQERVDRRRVRIVAVGGGERALLDAACAQFQEEVSQLAKANAEESIDIVALCERTAEGVA